VVIFSRFPLFCLTKTLLMRPFRINPASVPIPPAVSRVRFAHWLVLATRFDPLENFFLVDHPVLAHTPFSVVFTRRAMIRVATFPVVPTPALERFLLIHRAEDDFRLSAPTEPASIVGGVVTGSFESLRGPRCVLGCFVVLAAECSRHNASP
jgi:hypothetical protein